jgi:hypothetical protein
MRYVNNPRQTRLIDPFEDILSPLAYKQLKGGWQHLFRETVLELMPVEALKKHFDPTIGQPTKELYSMCGLVFITEFMDWTIPEAANAYMFRTDIQYALNLEPEKQSMSERTVERYKKLVVEDDLAARIMNDITMALVEKLDLSVEVQRLDSTHVFSDMAQFGRTRMMGVAVKRFLTQLKRHDEAAFESLPEVLRMRYQPSAHLLFGDVKKDAESRRLLRQQVAEDMHDLIERFSADVKHNARSTFTLLVRVFNEQCEIIADKIEIRAHPGGDVVQNTSDQGATRDGKKGPGYQVQLAETCDTANDVQLIVAAIPQTAAEQDPNAVEPVLDVLSQNDVMPKVLFTDTAYGSDENVQKCESKGVEMVSPTPGQKSDDAYAINSDDFVIAENSHDVECCPRGETPLETIRDDARETTLVVMPATSCDTCPQRSECPVKCRSDGNYEYRFTDKQRRLDSRRREEATDVFRERYRKRSGIEATNSMLKRVTGMGRLRVRGSPGVFHSILLKVAGWNLFQAARALAMRKARRLAVAVG